MDSKKIALDTALAQIEKKCGKGSIMRLGENAHMKVASVSTGSLSLDFAIGIGGIPKGRITEIYGPESSGKTTVALHSIAEVQKKGGEAAFIDAEHALDPIYAKALGVNIDTLLVSQPDSGEQALEITEALVRSGAIDIVVIDSVAALVPQNEIDGDMGQAQMGAHAKLMSQALRKLSGAISKSNCIIIFINQLRQKIGVIYGNPETTTGGQAMKFYASVRIDVRRTEQIKSGTDIIGNHIKCKVVKNKVAPPFKTAEFDIMYGTGISKESEIIEIGVKMDILEKSGSWYSYNGQKLCQGKDSLRELLKKEDKLSAEIESKIRMKLLDNLVVTNTDVEDELLPAEFDNEF
ncbi:MAG: recombinase RecA [Clostridiales bacterium GWF2_38_85]|nr:MAG: recombinase RecA [Clostridiales bacterium GWF2_38_85]